MWAFALKAVSSQLFKYLVVAGVVWFGGNYFTGLIEKAGKHDALVSDVAAEKFARENDRIEYEATFRRLKQDAENAHELRKQYRKDNQIRESKLEEKLREKENRSWFDFDSPGDINELRRERTVHRKQGSS